MKPGTIVLLICATVLGTCSLWWPHWTYRYRLTVEVERDGRIYSGSSVIKVRRERGLMGGVGGSAEGEAVAVDLGRNDVLFAILSGAGELGEYEWPVFIASDAFADRMGPANASADEAFTRLAASVGARAVLSKKQYPTLVHFRDIRNSKSVESVDPNNLEKTFGPNTTLRRIMIQITDDRVTHGIENRLPWLNTTIKGYLDGQSVGGTTHALSSNLVTGNFERDL